MRRRKRRRMEQAAQQEQAVSQAARRLESVKVWGESSPDKFFNADPLTCYTRYGSGDPATLHDIWRNCSAFMVCGGPSLKTLDLGILQARGVVSLGINNAAGYARTDAVTFSDPTQKFHSGILHDPKVMKFVPTPRLGDLVRYKTPDGFKFTENQLRHMPNVWAYDRDSEMVPANFLTTPSASCGRNRNGVEKLGGPKIIFTFFLGLRILHYFGVRQVFLLGCDFGMDASRGEIGNYAFDEIRRPDAIKANENIYQTGAYYLNQLKPVFDAAGFRVYNCNPVSQLKVFPHVPFDEASEVCRNGIPREPFDLTGWYDKS